MRFDAAKIRIPVVSLLAFAGLGLSAAVAQNQSLNAVFTPAPIQVDGKAEEAWSKATASDIAICMQRNAPLRDCKVSGTVQALWNGPVLYLLFNVTDADVVAGQQEARRSGVQVYVDQYDDKFPKVEAGWSIGDLPLKKGTVDFGDGAG